MSDVASHQQSLWWMMNHLGRITVHRTWLFTPVFSTFMQGGRIIKAQANFFDGIDYVLAHTSFLELNEGEEPRRYILKINPEGDRIFTELRSDLSVERSRTWLYLDQRNHGTIPDRARETDG